MITFKFGQLDVSKLEAQSHKVEFFSDKYKPNIEQKVKQLKTILISHKSIFKPDIFAKNLKEGTEQDRILKFIQEFISDITVEKTHKNEFSITFKKEINNISGIYNHQLWKIFVYGSFGFGVPPIKRLKDFSFLEEFELDKKDLNTDNVVEILTNSMVYKVQKDGK